MTCMPEAATAAQWVWCEPRGLGRNVFAVLRRILRLEEPPVAATLHLFADSRYRLRVNGAVVAAGPARFVPSQPEYDSIDLTPWLRAGENVLTVEVNHYGACSYQAMPDDRGGFVAWGSVTEATGTTHSLSTPGEWRVWRCDAWYSDAPRFSFALPAVEDLDTRRWDGAHAADDADWRAPVSCDDPAHWGPLAMRSIPPPYFDEVEFLDVVQAVALQPEHRHAVCVAVPGLVRKQGGTKRRFAVSAWLRSDSDCDSELGLFWGPYHLNGKAISGTADPRRGNRINYPVHLRSGWHLLYGEVEQLEDVWGVLLALPMHVSAHVAPESAAAQGLRCTEALPEEALRLACPAPPATLSDLQALAVVWRDVPLGSRDALPARECAWDVPNSDTRLPAPTLPLTLDAPRAWTVVFDFGGEFLGHVAVELEAPRGTLLDVAVDERLRDDGLPNLFATNPFADTADRYHVRGGPQRVEGFHVRGGRYLALTLRPPADATGFMTLTRVAIRRARTALVEAGVFASSDGLFDWVWRTGVATLHACTEDAYLDCPWRERGLYGGDFHVIAQIQRLVSNDASLVRRCLRLFAQARREDGLLPNVAPAWNRHELADFTLLWILTLRDHWRWTGDEVLVREAWPVVEGIWRSTAWSRGKSGLWDTGELRLFVDWGCPKEHRCGAGHGVLNVLRVAALRATAELATVFPGGDAGGDSYAREANEVAAAIQQLLWLPTAGAFAPRLPTASAAETPSLHASILALAFGVESDAQTAPLLDFVRRSLRDNFAAGVAGDRPMGHAELYFLHYALRALYRFDLAVDAEDLVRTHYAPLQAAGAWTLWECFSRGLKNVGSLCHAWSGGPLVAFARDIVGLQPQPRGAADVDVLIAPCSETLEHAEATVPHPRGELRVAWRVEEGELRLHVDLPADVTWRVAPRGRLAHLPLRVVATTHAPSTQKEPKP